jgi:dolichol-phosphate mannosyltransferase
MDTTQTPMQMAVIVPTLNEFQNIAALLDGIMTADARLHAIVVDDGSSDGTDKAVQDKAQEYSDSAGSRIHLIERGKKMGYASAVQDGMRLAMKSGATRILQMDADFSHDPKRLPALIEKSEREDLDLVIGSRYVPGGGTENWGLDRKILSGGANLLVRTLLGLKVRDCTGGFRCWKRELIERAGVLDLKVEGYAFLFITMDRCARQNAKVGEVPIIFVDRQYGKSKMSRRIIFEAMRVLLRLSLSRFSRRS